MNKLYKLLNNLTGNTKMKHLPDGSNDQDLANSFCDFFKNKIANIISNFSEVPSPSQPIDMESEPLTQIRLDSFKTIDKETLTQTIKKMKRTNCELDPIPISDLVEAENFHVFMNIILLIVNVSIQSNIFPRNEKSAVVKPVLKGNLDCQNLSSYRPISNLPFLSKVLEYTILNQLMKHLEETKVLPDNQSAYRQLYRRKQPFALSLMIYCAGWMKENVDYWYY